MKILVFWGGTSRSSKASIPGNVEEKFCPGIYLFMNIGIRDYVFKKNFFPLYVIYSNSENFFSLPFKFFPLRLNICQSIETYHQEFSLCKFTLFSLYIRIGLLGLIMYLRSNDWVKQKKSRKMRL